jgi:hypothetical protein
LIEVKQIAHTTKEPSCLGGLEVQIENKRLAGQGSREQGAKIRNAGSNKIRVVANSAGSESAVWRSSSTFRFQGSTLRKGK